MCLTLVNFVEKIKENSHVRLIYKNPNHRTVHVFLYVWGFMLPCNESNQKTPRQ